MLDGTVFSNSNFKKHLISIRAQISKQLNTAFICLLFRIYKMWNFVYLLHELNQNDLFMVIGALKSKEKTKKQTKPSCCIDIFKDFYEKPGFFKLLFCLNRWLLCHCQCRFSYIMKNKQYNQEKLLIIFDYLVRQATIDFYRL